MREAVAVAEQSSAALSIRGTCAADETREAVAVAEQSIRCCAVLPYRFEFIFVCFDVAFLCVGHVARALLCYL